MTLHIYDGLNVIRRAVDTDPMGRAPRKLVTQMLHPLPGDVHIWTFEGRGHLKGRRAIFPNYKDRPSTMSDGFFQLAGFIQECFKHTNAMQVAVPEREADDVIANLVAEHAGKLPIKIHTTDRDLNQLLVFPNVITTANPIEAVEPRWTRLYKTYRGDPSDKIPGLQGFGMKAWERCKPELLNVAHQALVGGRANPDLFIEAGVLEPCAHRACEQADFLRTLWTVVGFLDVSADDLAKNLITGTPDAARADAMLREFHH